MSFTKPEVLDVFIAGFVIARLPKDLAMALVRHSKEGRNPSVMYGEAQFSLPTPITDPYPFSGRLSPPPINRTRVKLELEFLS